MLLSCTMAQAVVWLGRPHMIGSSTSLMVACRVAPEIFELQVAGRQEERRVSTHSTDSLIDFLRQKVGHGSQTDVVRTSSFLAASEHKHDARR